MSELSKRRRSDGTLEFPLANSHSVEGVTQLLHEQAGGARSLEVAFFGHDDKGHLHMQFWGWELVLTQNGTWKALDTTGG